MGIVFFAKFGSVEQQNAKRKNVEQQNVEQQNVEQQNVEQQNVEQQNVEQQNVEQQNVKQQNVKIVDFVTSVHAYLCTCSNKIISIKFTTTCLHSGLLNICPTKF
jgi:hypothetical protein